MTTPADTTNSVPNNILCAMNLTAIRAGGKDQFVAKLQEMYDADILGLAGAQKIYHDAFGGHLVGVKIRQPIPKDPRSDYLMKIAETEGISALAQVVKEYNRQNPDDGLSLYTAFLRAAVENANTYSLLDDLALAFNRSPPDHSHDSDCAATPNHLNDDPSGE